MAAAAAMSRRHAFGCSDAIKQSNEGSPPGSPTDAVVLRQLSGWSRELSARSGRASAVFLTASGRSPWMKVRVEQLMRLLADEHQIHIPRRLIRAELSTYLTNVATMFRVSRMEARRFVTDEMLRASACEIADAHHRLMKRTTR
ncbi:hypothetical protein H7J08_00845 [Mycobacterium frederiksbergense]|uniref:hypothetical protein n=1 Tax=Mycolicibacterium frederiksbergense TaxID=117567 RepID=UPI0021F2B68B|nr:hypothetical protein [Mycolicibacterium frederiksbergense]MCV7043224.1 hypothetical protein [Mycolicibacterium frederiksbergense]